MDSASIRNQINRIERSASFAGKSQLIKLLELLFDHMDSQTTLKPDCVIKGLWPQEIRTKRSADVATEINRLRRALECYYSGEGQADPIKICLPNRSPSASNGTKEKRWIVAEPRGDTLKVRALPALLANPRKALTIIAAIAVFCVVAFLLVRKLTVVDQPRSARLDGSTLIVMNAKGEDLWRKSFPDGFSLQYYEKGLASRMWIGNLNGKGDADVLFLYQPMGPSTYISRSTTLICYSDRGDERWRWTPGRELPELKGDPATFETDNLKVLKAAPGTPSRIVVSSHHVPWYPHQIAILSADGKTLSEYWHSGRIDFITLADLDGDGREEIIATGISAGYRAATLLVLDPDRAFGASVEAARPEVQLHGMGTVHERIRLVFHRSDLNTALASYNEGQAVAVENGKIRFSTLECRKGPGCLIWYEFDKDFHLLSVYPDDYFRGIHNEFYRSDRAPHVFTAEEAKEFQQVRCLVGCKTEFVLVDFH
ncbi:MAG TPA: hypothetical protein VMU45_01885 [Candidatus Eisenbacteria bacterium]|nr:hypothetical protein [Candidatus Eisenbacteria bacterium]